MRCLIHGSSGLRPSTSWLGNEHPQGVPATVPVSTPSRRVPDPVRDPRFLATGRAATAAMTCGEIDVLTSTPCGSQSLSLRCAATRMGAGSGINSHTSVLATSWFDRCLGNGYPCGCSHAGSQMSHPCTAGRTWEVNAGSAYARHTTLVLDSSLRMADELSFLRSGVRQEQLTSRLPPDSLLPRGAANIAPPRGAVVSYSLLRSSYCKNNPNHRDGTAPDGVSQ